MNAEQNTLATEKIITHITASKDEILSAIYGSKSPLGRPPKNLTTRRGPKDTRMMKVQRTALVMYVTIELHKHITDLTLTDAYHVWHLPENKAAWEKASMRKDLRRGYKDYTSLYAAVKTLASKDAKKLLNLTAI